MIPRRFILLASSATVLLILFWVVTRNTEDQPRIVDLSGMALEVFDPCIDAVIANRRLTEAEFVSTLQSIAGPAQASLRIGLNDNFACQVTIPEQNYEPRVLRERLEAIKVSNFDGRARNCYWRAAQTQGRLSTILTCRIEVESDPANNFEVGLGFSAQGLAAFWVRPLPMLTRDADGHARISTDRP